MISTFLSIRIIVELDETLTKMLLTFIICTILLQITLSLTESDAMFDKNSENLNLTNLLDIKLSTPVQKFGELNKLTSDRFSDGHRMMKDILQNYIKKEDYNEIVPVWNVRQGQSSLRIRRQTPGNEETNMMIGTFQAIMRPMSMAGVQTNSNKNSNTTEKA